MARDDRSLAGKVVMITGATNGLGRVAAGELARMGARLHLVCRNRPRAERVAREIEAETGNGDIQLLIGDLSSQREVRGVAAEFLASGEPLDVLLNNAGAIFGLNRQKSVDGFEMTFALNHLAYFTLTLRLLARIKQSTPARIINVCSDAYTWAKGGFDFEDYNAERSYGPMRQYAQSKLANILFTRELTRRVQESGITVNCVTPPGFTGTGFAQNTHFLAKVALKLAKPFVRSARKGAAGLVYLCSSPEVEGLTGAYFIGLEQTPLKPELTSDTDAERLWKLSTEATGEDA